MPIIQAFISRLRIWLRRALHGAILIVFFLVPWWLRPDGLPHQPYFFGFLITIPVWLTLGLWVVSGLPGFRQAIRTARCWGIAAFGLLSVWGFWSSSWAFSSPQFAIDFSLQLLVAGLFALVVMCAGPSPRQIAVALAMGIIFQGVIVIAQVRLQHPVGLSMLGEFEIRPNNFGLNIVMAGKDRLMRPYGLTIHPNVIGGYLTVALLALSGWLVADPGLARWRQIVRLGVWIIGLWALCLTFSRSAIGALVVGGIVIGLAWLRRGAAPPIRQRLIIAGIAAIIVIGLFVVGYSKYILARAGTGEETTEKISIAARNVYIRIALQVIKDHPLNGIGMANFPFASDAVLRNDPNIALSGDNVHNVPLLALSELGIIGFGLWASVLGIGLWIAWRSSYDPFAVGLAAGTVALLAIGFFDHYTWTIMHYELLLWAGLGAAINLQHTRRSVIEPVAQHEIAAPDQPLTTIDRVAEA